MRRALLLILVAIPSFAQFQDLATTDDGATLYFSSRFRQTGEEEQFLHPKIFRWSHGEFELVVQRPQEGSLTFSNFYQLLSPDVSGDGSMLTAVAYRPCFGGSGCVYIETFVPEIVQGEKPVGELRTGKIQVSRNGQFLLTFGSTSFESRTIERLDLQTGERATGSYPLAWAPADRQCVTSDGRVLLASQGALSLWDGRTLASIAVNASPTHAIVSDDGGWAIYERGNVDEPHELWTIRMDGSNRVQLAEAQVEPFLPAISNDGRFVVFVANRRVVVADLTAGAQRELDEPSDYATEATISGDGTIVYATTLRNSLWRINLISGAAEELVPGVVAADGIYGAPVPGSLNWLRGSGLAPRLQIGEAPFAETLEGVTVEIGGTRAAMIATAPEQLVYQIPWEATLGKTQLRISATDSPFEWPPLEMDLVARRPDFIEAGFEAYADQLAVGTDIVVDQNFQSLVSPSNRARTGDIVHVYATGLGSARGEAVTGRLTPLEPLPSLSEPLECMYSAGTVSRPLPLLYAGLAPGLIGVYQVSFRIPDDVAPFGVDPSIGSLFATCAGDGDSGGSFSVPLRFEE